MAKADSLGISAMPSSGKRRRRRTADRVPDLGISAHGPGRQAFTIGRSRPRDLETIKRGDRALERRVNRADETRQVVDEGGRMVGSTADVELQPILGFGTINLLYSKSSILPQCVDTMVTNIAGWGHRVVPFSQDVEPDPEEVKILQSWIDRPNVDESMLALMRRQIHGYERLGLRYLEVIRNRVNEPTLLKHANVSPMRMTAKQNRPVTVTRQVLRGGKRVTVKERKRFRKYVQRAGRQTVYFKEFGDPRTMNWRTGEYQSRKTGRIPEKDKATEILFKKQESEDTYGQPRWLHVAPAILGSREAEEVNLRYFEDNTIPPAIITVSGGRLTKDSFNEIRRVIEEGGMGHDRQHQMLLLEAIPETGGIEERGVASLHIEKLASERQSDGLFKEFDDANMAKQRSAFRLPPVMLGQSQDVTFATANVSAFLAEMQVFLPERRGHDEWLNNSFINHADGLDLKTVRLESRGPALANPQDIVKALVSANTMGAITPRVAIDILNEQLQINIPQYPARDSEGWEEWMDQPMPLSVRQAADFDDDNGQRTREEQQMTEEDSEEREAEREGQVTTNRRPQGES